MIPRETINNTIIISDIDVIDTGQRMAGSDQLEASPGPALTNEKPSFLVSLASGGAAGVAVDISLFPLDTIKTRSGASLIHSIIIALMPPNKLN